MKFIASPPTQSQFQADTGYYPIRKAAYDEGPSKEWAAKYPQFLTAVDQIRQAPQNRATNGAVIGVFAQARQRIQKAIEEVLLGKSSTKDSLDTAAADVNAAIDKYNKTTK